MMPVVQSCWGPLEHTVICQTTSQQANSHGGGHKYHKNNRSRFFCQCLRLNSTPPKISFVLFVSLQNIVCEVLLMVEEVLSNCIQSDSFERYWHPQGGFRRCEDAVSSSVCRYLHRDCATRQPWCRRTHHNWWLLRGNWERWVCY